MTRPRRVRIRTISAPLAILLFLAASPAFPSGFQINTQSARAMGMGLAFTAVADDPSAIFFNPAGLGWQKHFEIQLGSSFLTKTQGDFQGENPFPGASNVEKEHKTTYVLPTLYAVAPLTPEINLGLGIFSQYGLAFRWDNPETFSGRFVGQNAVIQSVDLNPVISVQPVPILAIAVGADYRVSKIQLERNEPSQNVQPFTNSVVDIAHIKLNSDLTGNHGWGWNAGILLRPVPQFSLGAAYRSKIKIDFSGDTTFQQRLTGDPRYDALVAAQLPQGTHPFATTIDFPESWNFGAAIGLPAQMTLALDADWTKWTRFNQLNVTFPDLPGGTTCAPVGTALCRQNGWKNSWAYRVGLEKKFSSFAGRLGYYKDKAAQPVENAGPLLAENDRDGYTLGFGYDTDRWGVDISDLYLKVKKVDTGGSAQQDNFFGQYKESYNVFAFSVRVSF